MSETTVTIPKNEYESLLKDSAWLLCLEAAGVDNWDGYDFAKDIKFDRWFDDFKALALEAGLPVGDKDSYKEYFWDDMSPNEAVREEKLHA